MQKSKKATIAIILFILLYGLLGNFKLQIELYTWYTYIINPLFWIGIAIALRLLLGKSIENKKLKKSIIEYTIIAVLAWIIIYMLSGLVVTFGKNPFSTSLTGFLYNLWIYGTVLISKEYIRYKIINNVYDKEKKIIAVLITIVFVVLDIEFNRFIGKNIAIAKTIKYASQNILPNITRNAVFSYICIYGNFVSNIIYQICTNVYFWVSPILPNSPWVVTAIIDTTVPIILLLYIMHTKNKYDFFRNREKIINSDPKNIITLVVLIILALWFAIGIFPIKPVTIASGSMEKELFVGDIVIVKKCNANDVNVGDIIEYQMQGYTVIHRIQKKEQRKGDFYFVTKGDNNNLPDKDEVREEQLIGKIIFKIRYLGYPSIWMHKLREDAERVEVELGN